MDATYYVVLIEVHLSDAVYTKGQKVSPDNLNANELALIEYGLAALANQRLLKILKTPAKTLPRRCK